MAVAYSTVSQDFANNLVNFPNVSKEAKMITDYIACINSFIKSCTEQTKTPKQLLKQYNEIVANSKKTDKAVISGKLNHTVNSDMCHKLALARKNLEQYRQKIK